MSSADSADLRASATAPSSGVADCKRFRSHSPRARPRSLRAESANTPVVQLPPLLAKCRRRGELGDGGRMRPRVFVGSSVEGLEVAKAIQANLDRLAEVEIWSQGVFGVTSNTLGDLFDMMDRTDFAVLVLTADDLRARRGEIEATARDNVVFELGLLMGALGRERTAFVFDRVNAPALPSDLDGINPVTYEVHSTGNLLASLGAACTALQGSIERAGPRPVPADPADGIDADRTYQEWAVRWVFSESVFVGYWRGQYEGRRRFTAQRPIPRFSFTLNRRSDDDIPFSVDGNDPAIDMTVGRRSGTGRVVLREPRFWRSRLQFDVDFEPALRVGEEAELEFHIDIPCHKASTLVGAIGRPRPKGPTVPGGGEYSSVDVGYVIEDFRFEVVVPQRLGAHSFGIDAVAFGSADFVELAEIDRLGAFTQEITGDGEEAVHHLSLRRVRPPRKRSYRVYWVPPHEHREPA